MVTGLSGAQWSVIAIAGLATAGVILRPMRWPEAIWATAGALALLALGLITPAFAVAGIARGTDVYLFLIGMMLLSELARREGLFDWLANLAVSAAKGSATRLFSLVYAVGVLVTVFLSNDATAVVLTPAVYAATRAARVADPLPYLLVCAFVANAASFVLPISNPANLVVFGSAMPALGQWLALFALPSVVSIAGTWLLLRFSQRRSLAVANVAAAGESPALSRGALLSGLGILATAGVLVAASALGRDLGLPTFLAGTLTCLLVVLLERQSPLALVGAVQWSVLPLVAGLFVLVEALDKSGLLTPLAAALSAGARESPRLAALVAGLVGGFGSNLVNNLPAGLIAGSAAQAAAVPHTVAGAIMIGIDLGPNLSVTGSLATILWLGVLRREGLEIGALAFLKIGAVVMIPTLLATLGTLLLMG